MGPSGLSGLGTPRKPDLLGPPLKPETRERRVVHSVLWPPVSGFILLNMECNISPVIDAGE